ncbi:16678_t:CDS:2, partial [Racocetra persica]
MENPEQREEGSRQAAFNSKVKCNKQDKIVTLIIYSDFNILDKPKPWWKNPLDECSVKDLISKVNHFQQAITSAVDNKSDELFWKGYIELHLERYLLECISAESNITLDISYHLARKVQNLHSAIIDTFPSIFFSDLQIDRFTPEFAKQLHQKIGNRLIKNAGQYKMKFVMAVQENYIYIAPDLIENRMEVLFRQCREKFEDTDLQLEDAIKYGAYFLVYFLTIHPFMNKNGRVARLLLSYLLSKFTVIPLSLYTGEKARNVYLQCLHKARYQDPFKSSALASFILECVYRTSYNMCIMMDIDISN